MKALAIRLISLFTCILLYAGAAAQERYWDYVITVKGDSIRCNITKPLIGALKYRSAQMSKAEKIEIAEIKEFSSAANEVHQRAVFKDSSSKPVYMNVLEKGKISLYSLVITTSSYSGSKGVTTSTSTDNWYVAKGSDYVKGFKSSGIFLGESRQSRKDYFGELLKDNPDVYNKYMAEKKFNFKSIRNMVDLYNTGEPLKDDN